MKRGLLLLVFLVFHLSIRAQTEEYELKVKIDYYHHKNFHCNKFSIDAIFSDGYSPQKINVSSRHNLPKGRHSYSNTIKYPTYKKIDKLEFNGVRYTGSKCRSRQREEGGRSINITNNQDCFSGGASDMYINAMWDEKATITITPIIRINDPGIGYLASEEPINIGLPNSNLHGKFFNWKYSTNGGATWRNLPYQFQGDNYISIKGSDFLKKEDIGKTISFVIDTKCNESKSNIVSYRYLKSAPKIIGKSISQPKCYDSKGSVRLYFNRQIESGETISYVLSDKTKPAGYTTKGPYYIPLINENNIAKFLIEPSTGKFYLDVENLAPSDNYFFEMIGHGSETSYDKTIKDSQYNGAPLYTDGFNYYEYIKITRPTPVDFSITNHTNVKCNGQSDGTIDIRATGGNTTGTYKYQLLKEGAVYKNWTSFSSVSTSKVSGLPKGNYAVKVQDANGCVAKEVVRDNSGNIIGLGKEKELVQPITEPLPLITSTVTNEIKEPTAYEFTDGVVSIKVNGGNHNNTGYSITWYKDGTQISNPSTNSSTSGKNNTFTYTERLTSIGKGKYKATVKDAKGCTTSITYTLKQPDPLKVVISVVKPISCNDSNTKGLTKIADGILKAVASGGVGSYTYTWKWREKEGESWKNLSSPPSIDGVSTYKNLGKGQYAVNVKDRNGVELGTYTNNNLNSIVRKDVVFTFEEPKPIVINHTQENVFCKGGNNAWIRTSVSGGTLKKGDQYTYEWKHEGKIIGTNAKIENLYAGEYILTVTDSNGCFEIKNVTITEPAEVLQIALVEYKQPKANGLTDGYIQYKITGGTANSNNKYNYRWTNAAGDNLNTQVTDYSANDGYYIKLNNIGKDTYNITVTDAHYSKTTINSSCIVTEKFEMEEPDPLELTVEETKVISCNALNEYGNPYSDGTLTARAKGGVWLQFDQNGGLPYYYTWKKKTVNGTWQILTNQTNSIATNLDAGEYAVNIKDANGVVLGTYGADNKLKKVVDTLYTLKEPPLLELSTTQQNVYCYAGSDAWAEVQITGGTAPYKIAWSNGDATKRATELSTGTYKVHVTDARGCEAITQVLIAEPKAPVSITYLKYNRPTSIGANDAWIEAVVTGGTSFDDGTYTYFWKNEAGTLLNAQTSTEVVNNSYIIKLNTITAGKYYLTVQDKNYQIATTKLGCTHANSEFVIHEPIEAIIKVETPISCNTNNEYQDPFSDGALIAHVTGGVPFKSGLPYIYHWKKQNKEGKWEALTNQLDGIAINLNDGNYALNVEDSKGTVMGTYSSDDLIKAIDSTFYFKEPDLLEVSFTTTEVNCDAGNDGSAKVHITGGTPPYNIKWSNGETTPQIKNLIGGTYFVFVTDSRGCEVSDNITIVQPGGIQFDVITQKNPTCFEGNDGAISVNVTGGVPSYEYQWNTGASTNSISNLSKGSYTLQVIDGQDCIAYKEIILENPEPVYIDLGEDRTLCNKQEVSLDIAIDDAGASYQWESDNGFTSTLPQVTLNKAGIYTATITTSLGCIGQDQIEIIQSNTAIDADFLITSQAFVGEEVVLVNVSSPLGEGTKWYVPDGVTIVSESNEAIILKFKETGSYQVKLRTLEGDCYQDYTKQIVVKEPTKLHDIGEAKEPFLKNFLVHPNPNDGNFTIEIELSETANVVLRLISLLTADVSDTRTMINKDHYSESYSLTLASGTYILLLETPKGNEVRRIIIR